MFIKLEFQHNLHKILLGIILFMFALILRLSFFSRHHLTGTENIYEFYFNLIQILINASQIYMLYNQDQESAD